MGLLKEFRDFAMRGNVVDMAVGVIIGGAFGRIVTSLVNDVMMPPIALWQQGADFSKMGRTIGTVTKTITKDGVESQVTEAVVLKYGSLFQSIVDFTIVAICLFLVIKIMNTARKRFEEQKIEKPAEAPADIKLLTEIRDLLAAK
ncbi:Large-conductance mechanosensitive channel [Anatilimnocola aggregata]|uniref:Large-conductance mechanosensitive channel n=2 Tax=Anatilimnocola aggregata TaxID=2528021 RepID=A0A517Y7Z3_9BACT|nr:Large-conductance mechanosensitive channel [Anatilimnocola aggregata]